MPSNAVILRLLAALSFSLFITSALKMDQCDNALGMESGAIPDDAITVSSSYDENSLGPRSARIRQEIHAGAWCPRSSISDSVVEWLEIDLRSTFVIIGMETQGRHGMGLGKEYAEFYRIMYMRPGFNEWRPYRDRKDNQVFEGNKDTRDSKFNRLDPPIIADKVRFIPFSKHVRTVCMRVELHGCNHTEDLVSYSARQGDALSSGIMMHDWIYDGGISADGWLHNGIGTLYDGRLGLEDFKHDSHSWVGWKRSSASLLPGTTEPFLRFSFHFQTPGNLSAILIHMNNKFSEGIQIFSEARVFLSLDGLQSDGPIKLAYAPDKILQEPRNVRLRLHGKPVLVLTLDLFFASEWMLISEISFEHAPPSIPGEILSEMGSDSSTILTADHLSNSVDSEVPRPPDVITPKSEEVGDKSGEMAPTSPTSPDESKDQTYIGVVIGTVVAIAVFFIVATITLTFRYRRRKFASSTCDFVFKRHLQTKETPGFNMTEFGIDVPATESPGKGLMETSIGGDDESAVGSISCSTREASTTPRTGGFPGDVMPRSSTGTQLSRCGSTKRAITLHENDYESVDEHSSLPLSGRGPPRLGSFCVSASAGHEVSTESEIALLPRITSQPGLSGQESVSPEPRHRSEKVAQRRERSRRQQFAIPRFNSERSPATTPLLGRHNSLRRSSSNRSSENDLFHPGHRYYVSSPECGIEFCGVREVPRESISFLERLGGGDFATIFLCKIPRRSSGSAEDYNLPGECFESTELVVLKTLTRCNASDSESATLAQEVALLSELRDPNIANIIGISRTTEDPLSRYSVIVEYLPFGDLHSFLRTKNRSAPGTEFLPDQDFDTFLSSVNKLTCGDLLFMATQIASGMMYLESLTCVHRDLAARNILVGSGLHVKISDFAMYQEKFSRDYYMFENTKLPIRWMAWEGISTGKWSGGSDVWAFSVTLWEIFTFAQGQPYDGLSDDEVIRNAIVHEFSPQIHLRQPSTCPKDLYGLMKECWNKDELGRPPFKEIHMFLRRMTLNYHND